MIYKLKVVSCDRSTNSFLGRSQGLVSNQSKMRSLAMILLSVSFLPKLSAYYDQQNIQYKFNRALRSGNFDAIISMVYDNPKVRWQSGLEAVKLSVEMNKLDVFRYLLDQQLTSIHSHGNVLLMHAIQYNNIEVVQELLGNKEIKGSCDIVESAVKIGNLKILDLLLTDERFHISVPFALPTAAGIPDPQVLEYLLRNHIGKVEAEMFPALWEHTIYECAQKNLDSNLQMFFAFLPARHIKEAVNFRNIASCKKHKAWKVLGSLMAVQFVRPPVIVPNLLFGVQIVLVANAKVQYPGKLKKLAPLDRIETVYRLGTNSPDVDAYLEAFWATYGELPKTAKCHDWLTELNRQQQLDKKEILAIGKAITPIVTTRSSPTRLLKIAKKIIASTNEAQ